MEIKFEENMTNLLSIKLWNYNRKSVFLHLIASGLITAAFYFLDLGFSLILVFAVTLIVANTLSMVAIFISSYRQSKLAIVTTLTLEEDKVTVLEPLSSRYDIYSWDQIKINRNKDTFFLSTKDRKNYFYKISLSQLSEDYKKEFLSYVSK